MMTAQKLAPRRDSPRAVAGPFDFRLGIDADVDRIVASYTSTLERWVRRAPEQYFWHHRRWKHQRPGTVPELGDPS